MSIISFLAPDRRNYSVILEFRMRKNILPTLYMNSYLEQWKDKGGDVDVP